MKTQSVEIPTYFLRCKIMPATLCASSYTVFFFHEGEKMWKSFLLQKVILIIALVDGECKYRSCCWQRAQSRTKTSSWYTEYGDNIEKLCCGELRSLSGKLLLLKQNHCERLKIRKMNDFFSSSSPLLALTKWTQVLRYLAEKTEAKGISGSFLPNL